MNAAAAALSTSLATASTAELLAFYNKHAAAPIARFSDRAAAVRRCTALIPVAVAKEAESQCVVGGHTHCPNCGVSLSNGYTTHDACVSDGQLDVARGMTHEFMCLGCNGGFGPELPRRVAGGSRGWDDPAVRAARAQRDHVRAAGVEYRSVLAAFVALELPVSRHIAFRKQLKAAGRAVFDGVAFEVV